MPPSSTIAVAMRGITKRFPGVLALDNVTLEVGRGELHAICGENGAGKSTLMKILSGVYQPDGGQLEVDGRPADFTGTRDADRRAAFHDTVRQALDSHAAEMSALVLRDYHAENLIWLPGRNGTARVGLLDFQDAARGHPVYDLVSLLKDARRDLAPGLEARMIDRFLDRSGMAPDAFHAAYATLGAQRNLRILGGFARLSMHYGKPSYVDLIPRVWRHLQDSLAHPALATLAKVVNEDLPPPDPNLLQTLKDQCGTVPTP